LSVALLRAVINMQIVAVNQFVLIPQSTVYEAIVVTGLSFFTLCVLCISAWQADAIVPAICSARASSASRLVRARASFPTVCTDNDVVLISQASVTLAGILGVEVLVIVAIFIVRRWRRRASSCVAQIMRCHSLARRRDALAQAGDGGVDSAQLGRRLGGARWIARDRIEPI
jgi:hypothetical protein